MLRNYFGHVISKDRFRPDMDKIAVITDYLTPKTVKKKKSQFIGLVGSYHRFLPNFSKIAQPLIKLTRKDVTLEWNKIRENDFAEALCNKHVLKYLDFSLPFYFPYCDSTVLSQKINCSEHTIYYISWQFNKAKRNYSTTEWECLCVVYALKKWHYLYGRKFTVVTDHRPLRWLLQMKEPTLHLARLSLLLLEYDFDIVHKAGKANANAGALSQIPVQLVTLLYEPVMCTDTTEFCANYESCTIHKHASNNKPAPLQKLPEFTAPFQRISMDIEGPLPTTNKGNKSILNLQDIFSKYPEVICILDQKAKTVARVFVTEVVARHVTPEQLLSDRGTNFTSQFMKEVNKLLTTHHPASNGQTECSHQTFVNMMSNFVDRDQHNWDDWLLYAHLA
ncbi:hypothetical protein PR048_000552 [Dryococelus australis]|uniref:Integrase catalytic domain-containing protein n=1 Tax=Dryococelus australis TaxID=614101 RepID=A0ABQ9IEZ7_9NEOP|nr:hypothetical protein PR048_000552 [Dryococelus australis]